MKSILQNPAFRRFRKNRRGWISLIVLTVLYAASFLMPGAAAQKVYPASILDPHLRPENLSGGHYPVAFADLARDGTVLRTGGDADRFSGAVSALPLPVLAEALETRFNGESAPAFETVADGVSFRLPATAGRARESVRVYLRPDDWRTAPPETDAAAEGAQTFEPAVFPFRPIPGHPMGFDAAGRDVFARIAVATRIAITFGLLLSVASLFLGILAGGVQGFFAGRVDIVGQRLTEIWSAIPFLYVMIFLGNAFGTGFGLLLFCYAIFNWIGVAAYVRAEFLRLRGRPFVDAARVQGLSRSRIMFRHILPNALTPLITLFPFLLVGSIGSLTALDYLGFGLPAGTPSWGELLAEAQSFRQAWWLVLYPSLATFAVMLLGVFVGEGVRDALDPRPPFAIDRGHERVSDRPKSSDAAPGAPALEVRDLRVAFDTPAGPLHAVDGVSFTIGAGETLAVVGESGCGKSVSAMSVLRLVPSPPGRLVSGSIRVCGQDVESLSLSELRKLRGSAVGMVFQDPMTALSPLHRIGDQMVEALRLHRAMPRKEALALASEWLAKCGIADPARCLREYPFRLSGGMQQRVMIASVLMTEPRLIIADEPTTALDVTVQAQVLDLMKRAKSRDTALLLITHNLAVARMVCDRVAVMYAGQIVETGPVAEVLTAPRHPYTAALLDAMPARHAPGERLPAIPGSVPSPLAFPEGCRFAPRCAYATDACRSPEAGHGPCIHPLQPTTYHPATLQLCNSATLQPCNPATLRPCDLATLQPCNPATLQPCNSATLQPCNPATLQPSPVLSVRSLTKRFPHVVAADRVSFDIHAGETLAIVGESGSGKTTIARMVAGLEVPTEGEILVDGKPLSPHRTRAEHRRIQMVFQDPFASLNPRIRIGDILREALGGPRGPALDKAMIDLLASVGLPPEAAERLPHEFSGGQLQRISIARALAPKPDILVCDEPVSALDVSVQAQVLNLLRDLKETVRPACLFITHDLGVVRSIADRIAVIHRGALVETGPAAEVLANPRDPYTKELLAAEPKC